MAENRLSFHPDAITEARVAYDRYAERSPTSAARFLAELDVAVEQIAKHPDLWPKYLGGTRSDLLRRFPYVVSFP
jgi:hypothetical protein